MPRARARIWLIGLSLGAAGLFVSSLWPTWTGGEPLVAPELQHTLACLLVALCLGRIAALGVRLARAEAELARRAFEPQPLGEPRLATPAVFSHRLRELGIEIDPPAAAQPAAGGRGAPGAAA